MRARHLAVLTLLLPSAALAQEAMVGDPESGGSLFDRQCVACHVIRDAAGEVLAGRNARTGPNLYNVVGRPVASDEEFDYSDLMLAYAESGAVWAEDNLVPYLQDPTGYLREATGEDGRSKMAFQVRDEQQAHDLVAFLATFSDPAATEGEAAAEDEAAEGEGAAETEAASE